MYECAKEAVEHHLDTSTLSHFMTTAGCRATHVNANKLLKGFPCLQGMDLELNIIDQIAKRHN